MITVEFTEVFDGWLERLRDRQAVARITARLLRLRRGHWGDVKPVGDGIIEFRVDAGPGYRMYAIKRGDVWVMMLAGGDKSSQRRDIEAARRMAKEMRRGSEDDPI
ncbi:type II toxin-antitoxin system RelE/ParE family toxin [uncultured Brevundimonas sp.]|uniref:type II toxin-antitoxin system RelE/ParE family toxin n=1 Tax=uncultured Brevundimonas sp. TaxID=213418 RepID=UPI002632B9B0|nr:type II toxin-antitoxin system RelE/ParE family toxin [uncultured Brevundimonas sp.]